MKLLLDENLSRRLVPFLQHDFPGTTQVVLLGMESASDKEVWQRAKDEGYVVVTRDADFQELSLVWGAPPQVIRLRTPNQTRAAVLKLLLDNKAAIASALELDARASIESALKNPRNPHEHWFSGVISGALNSQFDFQ